MSNDKNQSDLDRTAARTDAHPSPEHARLLAEFERFIHRDPARRGLCASESDDASSTSSPRLGAGQLAAAAANLAQSASRVAIVTGFYIPHAQPPCAETDGPPGSLFLAHCLKALGIDAAVITDEPCASTVQAAADGFGFPTDRLFVSPLKAESWCDEFLQSKFARSLTHLVAIERVGPSHTAESVGLRADG